MAKKEVGGDGVAQTLDDNQECASLDVDFLIARQSFAADEERVGSLSMRRARVGRCYIASGFAADIRATRETVLADLGAQASRAAYM